MNITDAAQLQNNEPSVHAITEDDAFSGTNDNASQGNDSRFVPSVSQVKKSDRDSICWPDDGAFYPVPSSTCIETEK